MTEGLLPCVNGVGEAFGVVAGWGGVDADWAAVRAVAGAAAPVELWA